MDHRNTWAAPSAAAFALITLTAAALLAAPAAAQEPATIERPPVSAFSFQHELTLPGPPDRIYDTITGDISGWWDHNFSGDPAVFMIEPWPGGRFLEQFTEQSRDGVLHGTVTVAVRPRLLRIEGPLGLTGYAVHGVYTLQLESTTEAGDSTRLTLDARMVGEIADGWPEAVEGVWRHFLFEGLQPYVEAGMPDEG